MKIVVEGYFSDLGEIQVWMMSLWIRMADIAVGTEGQAEDTGA